MGRASTRSAWPRAARRRATVAPQEAGGAGEEDLHGRGGPSRGGAAPPVVEQVGEGPLEGDARLPAGGGAEPRRVADLRGDVGRAASRSGSTRTSTRALEAGRGACRGGRGCGGPGRCRRCRPSRLARLEQQPVGAHDVAHVREVAHRLEVAHLEHRRRAAPPRSRRSAGRRSSPRRPRRGPGPVWWKVRVQHDAHPAGRAVQEGEEPPGPPCSPRRGRRAAAARPRGSASPPGRPCRTPRRCPPRGRAGASPRRARGVEQVHDAEHVRAQGAGRVEPREVDARLAGEVDDPVGAHLVRPPPPPPAGSLRSASSTRGPRGGRARTRCRAGMTTPWTSTCGCSRAQVVRRGARPRSRRRR